MSAENPVQKARLPADGQPVGRARTTAGFAGQPARTAFGGVWSDTRDASLVLVVVKAVESIEL